MAWIYTVMELSTPDGTPTGRYHMVSYSDESPPPLILPIGYCAEQCPGHTTPEGAQAHYYDYLADRAAMRKQEDVARKCVVCGAWTQTEMWTPGEFHHHAVLCPEHATRDHFRAYLAKK